MPNSVSSRSILAGDMETNDMMENGEIDLKLCDLIGVLDF